jgi:predicted house-cleaning noncanonical NTP pyrophosphatase (MazG superfamily)
MSNFYLKIVEIETGKLVHNNNFNSRADIAKELENWDLSLYCYSIEEKQVNELSEHLKSKNTEQAQIALNIIRDLRRAIKEQRELNHREKMYVNDFSK